MLRSIHIGQIEERIDRVPLKEPTIPNLKMQMRKTAVARPAVSDWVALVHILRLSDSDTG
jgi:hypothetical protein